MDPIGKKLLDVAKSQLGYKEKSDGYTKYGDWYAKNIDQDSYFKTAPWCDMFLAWAANQVGIQESVGEFSGTVDHAKWFKKNDAWGRKPEPGAIVFYSWSGSDDIDDINHVGIVEKVDGGTIHTIEANVDGVHLKRKARDTDNVVGYGYPSQVKVAAAQKYVPKHAAPPPTVESLTGDATGSTTATRENHESPLPSQEVALGGLLALVLFGTLALSVGKATATKLQTEPPIRVRKRGKHHRTPVSLPPDMAPADLDAADSGTAVMPALSAATAAEAEDREFWGKIAHLKEDEELAFWDTLHSAVTATPNRLSAVLEPPSQEPLPSLPPPRYARR